MNAIRRHHALLLAVAGGVVFALSSPPTDFYPAVLVGLAILCASLADAPTFWRAFGRGAAWATAAGIVGLRFVPSVIQRFTPLGTAASYAALVLLAAGQSLVWAVGSGCAGVLHRRAKVPLELSFAAGTMIALLIPTVFAWTPAGLISTWPSLVQLADVLGERGVSVLLAFAAALLARAGLIALDRQPPGVWARLARRRVAQALSAALAASVLLVALAVHGRLRMASIRQAAEALPTVRLGLVNQAVGPTDRWDPRNHTSILRTLRDLTRRTEAAGAELTVWPEAAYPYALDERGMVALRGAQAIVGAGIRGPVLTGLIKRARPTAIAPDVLERNSYNSATIVMPDGSMQPTYDKLQLLWFGEMVPGGAYLPWLRRLFQKSGGLVPGKEPRALRLPRTIGPPLQIGVLNCYEDTLPGVGRILATSLAPNLLVNVTNDAWFVGTAEPELHARLAVMRAIELRRDLVRAVNLGVVSWVDASGTVRARDDSQGPGIVIVSPAIRDAPLSFYARFGDAPVMLLLAAAALAFAWKRRQESEASPAPPETPAPGGKPAGESPIAPGPSSTKNGPAQPDQAT